MAVASTKDLLTRTFLFAHEVAKIIGADERTVRRAIERGEIPATRIGSTTRVPTAWVRRQALLDDEPADA